MDELVFEIVWEPACLGGAAHAVVDVLRTVNAIARLQRPTGPLPMHWRWLRSDGRPMNAADRRQLASHEQPGKLPRNRSADVIVVPGWIARDGPELDELTRLAHPLCPRLRRTLDSGGALLGVFTGVALLAASGTLAGRRATAPWPFMASVLRQALMSPHALASAAQPIEWVDDPAWTSDRGVWTCATAVAVTEATLDLIGCTPWTSLAFAARDVLLPTPIRQGVAVAHARSAGRSLAASRVPTGIVERARQWLVDHLAEPYDVRALALASATSPRSLARHFGSIHAMSPYQYLERLRVERASLLLQTTYLPVNEIGNAVGMPSASTLRRVFLRHKGELPGDFRQRYRLRTQRPLWGSGPLPASIT